MLDSFFGIHPHVIRSGLWAKMKPGEKDLYVYLMHESERCRTRQLTRTDAKIRESVGLAPRTASNARKRLQEYGLIVYQSGIGNRYVYTICHPQTAKPYAGDPRKPAPYEKRSRPGPSFGVQNSSIERAKEGVENYGQPLDF